MSDDVIRVHVANFPAPADPKREDRNSTFGKAILQAATPIMVLAHAPRRRRAVLSFLGVVADVIYVCNSFADAQVNAGMPVTGVTPPLELSGSDEVWVVSATTPTVGYVAEYCPL